MFRIITIDQLLQELAKYNHTELHVHHTWRPSHKDFNGSNHIALQEGMRNYHVNTRGWDNIAQHVTLMPDGKFVTGRPFNSQPCSISGKNGSAGKIPFMVEMLGDFDMGHDKLQGKQLESILQLARYFDRQGKYIRFHRENASKSCPGTGIDKNWFMAQVRKPVKSELELAIEKLVAYKIINTPEYWLKNAKKGMTVDGEYAALLIQRFAKELK